MTFELLYNYLFTKPLLRFGIDSAVVINLIMFILVAVVTSQLASAARKQALITEAHALPNATIAGFARRLLSCTNETEIARTACAEIHALLNCNTVALAGLPQPATIAAAPADVSLTPTDLAAAVRALQTGNVAGQVAASPFPAEWVFHPITSEEPPLALGLSRDDGANPVSKEQRLLLESLLDQVAMALTRAREIDRSPCRSLSSR